MCTRSCKFCAIRKASPLPPDEKEPLGVAEAAKSLNLRYAVITSVTRDDLPDGGASHFATTIIAVRKKVTGIRIEALIPDFNGSLEAIKTVLDSAPDVVSHNLETVEALYSSIGRRRENYWRSLSVLEALKRGGAVTKSGLMLGLGEEKEEILQTFSDLRNVSCELLTIGQYLQPGVENVRVKKYYSPLEFTQLKHIALDFGFLAVESGPLVRSSFNASKMYQNLQKRREETRCDI